MITFFNIYFLLSFIGLMLNMKLILKERMKYDNVGVFEDIILVVCWMLTYPIFVLYLLMKFAFRRK